MIETYADGTHKCFKCRNKKPTKSFMYNNEIDENASLSDFVEMGHAWACVDCFLESGFCRQLAAEEEVKCKPSDRWPEIRYEDLTKCIHCQMYWPFWSYNSYNLWRFDSDGNSKDITSPEALHAFINEHGLIWGCRRCYKQSGLNAVRKEGGVRWRRYKPAGGVSWADMAAQYYRRQGDYQAVD
jgi:hypothetical protein